MRLNLDMIDLIAEKTRSGQAIEIVLLGAGWYGSGLAKEFRQWPEIKIRAAYSHNPQAIVELFAAQGIAKNEIVSTSSSAEFYKAVKEDKYVVLENIDMLQDLPLSIDAVYDATGDVSFGARAAAWTIRQKRHFLHVNSEMGATVGFVLGQMAKKEGVVFSNSDGDQPGVLARMVASVRRMGLDVLVAGNGKGFLNYHNTMQDVLPFVGPGHNVRKILSFSDGTKQSMEMAVLANGVGLSVDKRGMHGLKTDKETLVDDIVSAMQGKDPVVEFVMGKASSLGMSCFVIGRSKDERAFVDLKYMGMGQGPNYLFFRDYHLCYLETPSTIIEAVLLGKATIAPQSLSVDVLTVAKQGLKAGDVLDGIGGDMVYGLIDKYSICRSEDLLPLGLAGYAVLKKDIPVDEPLTYDAVDLPEDDFVVQLRRQQENLNS